MKRILAILTFGVMAAVGQEPATASQVPPPAGADRPVMRTAPDPATPARVGISLTQRKLTVQEAIEMALENNLEIEIEGFALTW